MVINTLKTAFKVSIIGVIIALIISAAFVWKVADNMTNPPRRALQEYHQQWLQNPEQEGISITRYDCAEGKMPCLLVTPSPDSPLGARGQRLRQQLQQNFQHQLAPYELSSINPKGLVVLLHGRAGRKEDLIPVAARLAAAGFVCVLPDLPAHGDSPLKVSLFGLELRGSHPNLINQSVQDIQVKLGKELPVFLWGMSMGGSYANYALEESSQNWQGLIIVSSFAEMKQVAKNQLNNLVSPLPQPLQPLMSNVLLTMYGYFIDWQGGADPNKVTPIDIAQKTQLPVLMFHGDDDQTIDISQGRALFESYPTSDKTWMTVSAAGHDNVLVTQAPVYATMADWLLRHVSVHESNHVSKQADDDHLAVVGLQ